MALKTLLTAVETSLKTARIAISDADTFLDAIKEETETMAAKVRIIEDVEIIPIVKALAKEEDVLKALRPGGLRYIDEEEETTDDARIVTVANSAKISTGKENKAVGEFPKSHV